jgi:hypothetical protein
MTEVSFVECKSAYSVPEQRLCQRDVRYGRIFDARRLVCCITTIRFSSRRQTYVLNQVNKACCRTHI